MKLSLGAALLAAVVLAASACGSSHPGSGPPPQTGPTVSSSRLLLGGTVRCTATLRTPVQAGHELAVAVRFHNLSTHAVSVPMAYGGPWVIVSSPDGTTYDTRIPLENERFLNTGPIALPAGGTKTEHLRHLRVRWEGPLRITPGCGVPASHPVRVAVASPGLPAPPTAAVTEVVAGAQHLLDHCRPRTSGVSVVGRIDPPSGTAPPLQARCSVTLRREGDFYTAQVLIVTPPDLRGASVLGPYEQLSPLWGPNDHRNAQVIGWEFVVTREGAVSVVSSETAETQAGGWAPDWVWTRPHGRSSGGSACGFVGGGSGNDSGPDVSFVSACGR